MSSIQVTIPNLPKLANALREYQTMSGPIVQRAINESINTILQQTTPETPIKTGNLRQRVQIGYGPLTGVLRYTVKYAGWVHDGTGPHDIRPVNKKVLANKKTGQIFGKLVHHPGNKANPFLARGVTKSQPIINNIFTKALDQVISSIANQAK